jgi:hypothetical protein
LTVNGPVWADEIKLLRTYGAFPGSNSCNNGYSGTTPAPVSNPICLNDAYPNGWKGSIAPAERFVLRPDSLYWAYAQAGLMPKAISVSTHEPAVNF